MPKTRAAFVVMALLASSIVGVLRSPAPAAATPTPSIASTAEIVPDGSPSAPRKPSAAPGVGSAVVSWSKPATDNGSAVTGYQVTTYVSDVLQQADTFMSSATSQRVVGLSDGQIYTFKVAAINDAGTGPRSVATERVTVGSPAPPKPASAVSGSRSTDVSWTVPAANSAPIARYYVAVGRSGEYVPQVQVSVSPAETSTTVTGLTAGQTYWVQVYAANSVGTGPGAYAGAIVPEPGAPSAPIGVTAVSGASSANVTWTAPYDGGSAVTGYVVTPYLNGVEQPAQPFESTAVSQTVTGLTDGQPYTFKVAAINDYGAGPQSRASTSVQIGVPSAPRKPLATAGVGSALGSVLVSWSKPATGNGSVVTGYVVTPYFGSVEQPQRFVSGTSLRVVGLIKGAAYRFKVAAVNDYGTGPSVLTTYVIIGTPNAPSPATAVAIPGTLSAQVSWTLPVSDVSPMARFEVRVVRSGVYLPERVILVTATMATSTTVTGLTAGERYWVTVTAVNLLGASPPR